MQTNIIYLYSNRLDVYFNNLPPSKERYRNMYQRHLKLFKGTDNRVDFRVRTADEKPRNIQGRTLVLYLTNKETGELVLKKDCRADDEVNGFVYIWFTQDELDGINSGFYNYSLTAEKRTWIDFDNYITTEKMPVFIDAHYEAASVIRVEDTVTGNVLPSYKVAEFKQTIDYVNSDNSYYLSSIIPVHNTVVNQKLHTFQLFFNNFTGKVILQASLENSASPNTWVDIKTIDYNNSYNDYINVVGKYIWFRFKYFKKTVQSSAQFIVNQTIFLAYTVTIGNGGHGYSVGQKIKILGSKLGGESPTNDLIITVEEVDVNGAITFVSWEGVSYNGTVKYTIDTGIDNTGTIDNILYR